MKFTSTSEKQKLSFLFAGYYVSSAVLILLLLTVFLVNRATDHSLDNGRKNGMTGEQQLAQACSLLQERLRDLQQLDEKYAALIRDSGVKANFDVLTGKIKNSELALSRVIDSVDKLPLYGKMRDQMNQLSYSCKAVLEYHRSIDELQQAVALASRQLNLDQRSLVGLSRSIAKRDSIIADIKVHSQSDNNIRSDSRISDADYRLLKSENNYLKSELDLLTREFQAYYEARKMAQSPDTKTAKSQHLNQSGKSAVTPTLNTGTNTKEVKYEGDPPKQ